MVVCKTDLRYIFLGILWHLNCRKKCVIDISNVLDIILKKYRTWELKLCCKGPNRRFFSFCSPISSWLSMKLVHDIFFWILWRLKYRKKCVTDIYNVLEIIKKNTAQGHLSFVASVQIIVFSIFVSYFEIVVHGTDTWYIFLGILWILNCKNNVS